MQVTVVGHRPYRDPKRKDMVGQLRSAAPCGTGTRRLNRRRREAWRIAFGLDWQHDFLEGDAQLRQRTGV